MKLFNIKEYILFSVIIISILHGITEPFAFSQYTGYIFWFVVIVLLYKKDQLKFDFFDRNFRFDINNFKNFSKFIILIIIIFNLYSFIKLEIKRNIYLDYYHTTLKELSYFYEQKPKDISSIERINDIQQKIKLLKILIFISPWEKENYSMLADYWINLYIYRPDKIYLKSAYENSCISFYFRPLINDYGRTNILINREKIENYSYFCKDLDKFDPYKLLENEKFFLR